MGGGICDWPGVDKGQDTQVRADVAGLPRSGMLEIHLFPHQSPAEEERCSSEHAIVCLAP